MSSRAEVLPKKLVVSVLLMTVVVFALGAALVIIKLKPAAVPTTSLDRNIEQWRQAIIANPDDDDARVGLGLALLDANKTGEAQGAFEDALAINDHNWMALMQLGLLAWEDDPDEALTLLARSASFAPDGSKVLPLTAQGDLLMEQSDPTAASSAYRQAIADTPLVFDAHLGLARSLEALGDKKGALAEYREAARFDPTNQTVQDAIAQLQGKGQQ